MIKMSFVQLIGTFAAVCTTIAFVPQVLHSYKTRDLSGISLPMYSIFTVGVALWLVYGVLKEDWPLILSNSITFIASLTILILKILQSQNK